MNWLIKDAMAAEPAAGPAEGLFAFLPLVVIFIIFYFLLIRPQSKRMKAHKAMVASLEKGAEVVTNGGLYGKITKVGENHVEVEIADNTVVQVQRDSISTVLPQGTLRSL